MPVKSSMRKKTYKVLMFSESSFPFDIRPKNEAYTLIEAGYKVIIIALRRNREKVREDVNGVLVYRIPRLELFKKASNSKQTLIKRKLNRFASTMGYLLEYFYFTSMCFFLSFYIFLTEGFDVIHTHNPPDTLFIIASFYKMFGKKFVFDHHDLSPELYRTKFLKNKGILYNLLVLFEGLSCKIANIIISTNKSYKNIEMTRHNINSDKIFIVRNNPVVKEYQIPNDDKNLKKKSNKIGLLFLGAINPQDGLETLLESLYYLVNTLGRKQFICYIVGDGDSLQSIKQMAEELNLSSFIDFIGHVSDRNRVIDYLNLADICVEPAPANHLNNHSTFIKIMEYMVVSKPIVAYDLEETRYSTSDSAILIKSGDIEGFANGIAKLIDDPELRMDLGKKGHERIMNDLNWKESSINLLDAYSALFQ